MKNILNEKPNYDLSGRLLASVKFVDNADVINKEVLDIGCGYGWCELNPLQRGVKKITALEISEEDLKTIKQSIVDEKLTFKTGCVTTLPFKNESFDTVVSWELIEHIPANSESDMFKEIYRVLRSDGCFYLSTPYNSLFSNILDPAWWFIGHRHYSEKDIASYARSNRFEIVKMRIKGRWWVLFSILNMYIAKWVFRRKSFFKDGFRKKANTEYEEDNGFVNIFIKLRKKSD